MQLLRKEYVQAGGLSYCLIIVEVMNVLYTEASNIVCISSAIANNQETANN